MRIEGPVVNKNDSNLAFGGQAIIEGVMIRSPKHMVICVRKPDNNIHTNIEKLNSFADRYKIFKLPLLRGVLAMIESLCLGIKGLFFSANAALGEDTDTENSTKFGYGELLIIAAGVLGLTSFFFIVPFLLTGLFNLTGVYFNVFEAIIRLSFFIIYLSIISRWGEFRRVLMYHGAEHKAINAYEANSPMDIEHVRKYSRLHPRCGTSFLFIVILVSILLFSIMPNLGFFWRLSYRILLIPLIAALSYELLKITAKYRNSLIAKIFTAPGLAFQRLTTKEPSNDMLEVSIKAVTEINKLSLT